MSGVEEVIPPPPDNHEKSVEKEELSDTIDGKDEDKASLTTSLTDSDSASLTGSASESWTLLEKEEDDIQKKTASPIIGSSVEDIVDQADDHTLKSPVEETDSESIETISDDECLVSHPLANSIHANLASFCYIPDLTDSGFPSSLTSTTSTISVASDGIPITDKSPEAEDGQPQYEWNNEGEKEIPEEERAEEEEVETVGEVEEEDDIQDDEDDIQEDEDDIQEDEDVSEEELEEGSNDESRERSLEPSEPGYDVDDDGLPGAPLPPLAQEVDLYPSQELDPSFPVIKRGEVYKYDKNLQLDHFLTAFVILALALVIGLGIGHFLGLFLSVTTSIHSSLFGLAPDPFQHNLEMEMDPGMIDGVGGRGGMFPFPDKKYDNPPIDSLIGEPENNHENSLPGDEFIDDFRSVNDFDISPEENDKFSQQLQEPVEPAESFSIIGAIKNVFTRLGTKLGYIKKSPNPDTVVHASSPESEVYYEFQCMTADDQPILINGEPVMVSEPHDCHQFYTAGQGEGHASHLEPPTIYMESARTVFKSDDQDLDDKVIRQLWDENQELRDQVHTMRTNVGDQGDEAMAAILRERINDLLTANADLEREVARLRYADAARGAAESVETLNKLRKTRDTLNDIVTENDQLKIEVAKARYGEPPAHKSTKAERDLLANENQELKNELEKLKLANNDYKSKASEKMHEKFENALKYLEELAVDKHIISNNNLKQDDLNTPWPSRRHEELKNEDEEEAEIVEDRDFKDSKDSNDGDDDDDDDIADEDDIKSKSMNNLSKYLSGLVGVGSKILTKQGTIDWVQAKKFVGGLKEDLSTKFEEAGKLAKEDIGIIVNKFDDLKNFVDTEKVKQNMKATQTAAGKLVKSLVGAVKDLKEASEDAAEKSDWINKFKTEANKVKSGLENKWYEIKDKWQKVVVKNRQESHEDIHDDDDDDDDDDKEKQRKKYRKASDEDKDEDEDSDYKKIKSRENKQRIKKNQWSDDDDDEGYHSYDEQKKRGDDDDYEKKHRKKNKKNEDDVDDDKDRQKERKYSKKRDESKNREYWTKENKTQGVDSDNWAIKRGEEREKMRRGEERADWIFERAKHRKDERYEETRGDWYFERKEHRDTDESYKTKGDYCDKDDDDCNNLRKKSSRNERRKKYDGNDDDDEYKRKREYSTKTKFNQKMNNDKKQRGERIAKKEKKHRSYKKNNGKYRGETNQWDYDDDEDDNHYNSYQFNEEVHYTERHYNDETGKNRHEKRAKRKLSKRENDKKFVIEADFEQFY